MMLSNNKASSKKFGLSNYSAAEVQRFIEIGKHNGYYSQPSVYQGHYNAIVRGCEKELFPLLRRHLMAFYAYSPAAGGLFSGNAGTATRWSKDNPIGELYSTVYGQPPVHAAVARVQDAAALRWTAFHSVLDGTYGGALIVGVSKIEQLHQSLDALEAGPLPTDLADAIADIYPTFEVWNLLTISCRRNVSSRLVSEEINLCV